MLKRVSIAPAVALLAALFIVFPRSSPAREIELRSFRFVPNDIRVPDAGAVTFTNVSDDVHTVTCFECAAPIDLGDVRPGIEKTLTFRVSGTYIFVCRYHQDRNMAMRIRVGAVASPGGTPSPSPTAPVSPSP